MAKAIHEFTGENTGELHFSVGDVIQVLREIDSNWSEGMLNNVSGIFPTAFVEIQTAASKGWNVEIFVPARVDEFTQIFPFSLSLTGNALTTFMSLTLSAS